MTLRSGTTLLFLALLLPFAKAQTAATPIAAAPTPTASPAPAPPPTTPPPSIDGAWLGTLDLGATKLRIVFHITSTASGLSATLDSPDQGASGIPTSSVTRTTAPDGTDTLTIEAAALHGTFTGTIAKDRTAITGTWTQGPGTIPLTLTPVKDVATIAAPRRPQNPTKPYPYKSIDLTYTNPTQHDTLAATLTIPEGAGPFPAVLLITGSGPQDRDETLLGHKPFLVLSDYLTRHGIVVLRADDRGTGQSTGDFNTATSADFATDAEAGIALLKTRPEVDPARIGLIGHSEGGLIAPMIAARNKSVAFIVLLAGPGVPGSQIIPEQTRLIDRASGMSADQAEKAAADERKLLDLVIKDKDPAVLETDLRAQLIADNMPSAQIDASIKTLTSPWFRYFITYDPATALRHVTCPVLALNGSNDLQVPPSQNLPAIEAALIEAGNTHYDTIQMPGLNHLFQTSATGSPADYARIEETISPVVLAKIAFWIREQ
jgi:pimeloyl-ACP methyl ester carboxylesterase